jgi:hypothetical protein
MNYFEMIPAELNELIKYFGFKQPDYLSLTSEGEYRSFEEICRWNNINSAEVDFKSIINALVNGNELALVSRIARRKFRDSWQVYTSDSNSMHAALSTSDDIMTLAWFENSNEFWSWLLGDFVNYQLPEIPLTSLETMSKNEMAFHLGLCDFFLRSFPVPDADWEPNAPLVFSSSSLLQDMKSEDGWTKGWNNLSELPILDEEDIEELALIKCNEQKIQLIDMPDGTNVFMLGNDITWLIRSMAWWDRGVLIKKDDREIFLIQASSLWIFANEGDFWEAAALSGDQLKMIVSNLMGHSVDIFLKEKVASSNENEVVLTINETNENESATHRFCHKCGKERKNEDVFCRYCGTKLL